MTGDLAATRISLQRVAIHVLARARHRASGRFGLRVTPGGIGTPAFGPDGRVLRIAGTTLLREVDGAVHSLRLPGASLASAAEFAGVDLSEPFDVGGDTSPAGDPAGPLHLEPVLAARLHNWWSFGWQALDVVISGATEPAMVQLWPEHFDAATTVRVGPGPEDCCNLGVSPGDDSSEEPYLYVGPWTAARPGEPGFWNAPFGAQLSRSQLLSATGVPDGRAAVAFLRAGVAALQAAASAGD